MLLRLATVYGAIDQFGKPLIESADLLPQTQPSRFMYIDSLDSDTEAVALGARHARSVTWATG